MTAICFHRDHWQSVGLWKRCDATAPPINIPLPCNNPGFPNDFFSEYWKPSNNLPLPTSEDAFARVLAWFKMERSQTVLSSTETAPKWHKLLQDFRNDLVYALHKESSRMASFCTHAVDFNTGAVVSVATTAGVSKTTVPKCEGAVICGTLNIPKDFSEKQLEAIVKKASHAGPSVIVTMIPSAKVGWGPLQPQVADYIKEIPQVMAWFTQGASSPQSSMSAIPGGWGSTTDMMPLLNHLSETAADREYSLLVTFDSDPVYEHNRGLAMCANTLWPFATVIPEGLIREVFEGNSQLTGRAANKTATRMSMLNMMARFRFVISPCTGKNLADCQTTWDALYVGTIPIVRRTGFAADHLWLGLPVLIVSSWDEIDEALLEKTWQRFKTMRFDLKRLRTEYYSSKILNTAKCT